VLTRIGVLIGMLAALVGVSPATASTSGVSVHGSGNVLYPNFPALGTSTTERTIVTASLGPDGQPRGSMLVLSPLGFVTADVTCLRVEGDTVYVGGTLVPGFNLYLGGETFAQLAFGIRDGSPDLVASAIFRRPDVNTCDVLAAFPPVFVVTEGDFTVATR
jgi:hypothetical protein